MNHYQHLEFFIPETNAKQVANTYVFLPTKYELPITAAVDCATQALEALTQALCHTKKTRRIPFTLTAVTDSINALEDIVSPMGDKPSPRENAAN